MMQQLLSAIILFIQSVLSPFAHSTTGQAPVNLPISATATPILLTPTQAPTNTPLLVPSKIVVVNPSTPAVTPLPESYNINYSDLVAKHALNDDMPQPPPIPANGVINGTNSDFIRSVKSDYLYTLHKAEIENTVYTCQAPDQSNWRDIGSHNVYTWKKYNIDNFHGDTTNYVNLLIQNPEGVYNSQRSDFQKIQSTYCKDRKPLPL